MVWRSPSHSLLVFVLFCLGEEVSHTGFQSIKQPGDRGPLVLLPRRESPNWLSTSNTQKCEAPARPSAGQTCPHLWVTFILLLSSTFLFGQWTFCCWTTRDHEDVRGRGGGQLRPFTVLNTISFGKGFGGGSWMLSIFRWLRIQTLVLLDYL